MAQGLEPFEFLDRPAVKALGLGLITEEQGPTTGLADQAMEAFGERVVAILGTGDFDIAITDEFLCHGEDRMP